ncbi:MAG TPA: histidine phosphatase family protein [Opitutaceae bacterium]|nr:histidine phosphatase family protein [Opitutaceae bacterium]
MTLDRRRFVLAAAALACGFARAAGDEDLWSRLRRGGLTLLIRHGTTDPGLGDPPHFRVEDCSTQRNLSAEGREEARRIGERMKRERVPIARVYTSPWCRCRDTAMLAFGKAEDWEALSSFFDFPDREADYTERVKNRIANVSRRERGNVVMVTHNVNIAALTRLSVAPAELAVVQAEGCCGVRTLGRLRIT